VPPDVLVVTGLMLVAVGMALTLTVGTGSDWTALMAVTPSFVSYVLSFIYLAIYWNNHHHMLRASSGIDGRSMWANLHLLFWLSLAPLMTAWLGENPTAAVPTALYGVVLFLDAVAFTLLQHALLAVNGPDSAFARAVKSDLKGKISPVFYLCAIGFAFVSPAISDVLFVGVAAIWIVPDRRFESVIVNRR